MRRTPIGPARRSGFTLVELLVVITIIAVLMALTGAAVVKVMGKREEAQVRNEITQLQQAIQAFKTDFQATYIPDRFVLPPALDPTGESVQYVSSLWPRIDPVYLGNTAAARLKWGCGGSGNQIVILQGHQALVFFLGGARDANGNPIGFSNSPIDPLDTTTNSRKGPYYEFPSNRLQVFPFGTKPSTWTGVTEITNNATTYKSYVDAYSTAPYLYFSAKKAGNDYNVLATDAQFGCMPFMISSTPIRFANPTGFQIISAGKDATFGTGGLNWAGVTGSGTNAAGSDDIANFHPIQLGIAAN